MISHSQAFHVNGIKAVFINGTLSAKERESVFAKYKQDPTIRVLGVTNIFSTGINGTVANIMIHMVSDHQ
jgi:superfamily II DNA or RNA helicase